LTRLTAKNFTAQGIVLGRRNFFESDRIIEIFTYENGRFRAVVKGARKPRSKLAGNTDLFTHGNFTFAKGKNLDIVTSIVPLDFFQRATSDLKKVALLFLISEALIKLLPTDVPNEKVFEETLNIFRKINRSDKLYLTYEYLYKLVVMLGYGFSISICSKCHKDIESLEKTNTFSFSSGGIICKICEPAFVDTLNLSSNTVKLLKYIEQNSFENYSKVKIDEKTQKELKNIIISYLNYIYQKELKSPKFIASVKSLK